MHKKGPKKSETGLLTRNRSDIFKNFNRVQTSDIYQSFRENILEISGIVSEKSPDKFCGKNNYRNRTKTIGKLETKDLKYWLKKERTFNPCIVIVIIKCSFKRKFGKILFPSLVSKRPRD